MTPLLTFINGEAADCLSSHDRGLAYGHGVFETMRLHQGAIPLRHLHLERLAQGLERLAIPSTVDAVVQVLDRVLPAMPDQGIVKLMVTAGVGTRGYRCTTEAKATIITHWHPAPAVPESMSLQLCRYRLPANPVLAGIKHLNRLDQVLAAAELTGNRQGLLLDCNDQVVEALSHNLFACIDGRWITPPLDQCGVAGVMRRYLIESLMPSRNLSVAVEPLTVATLAEAEALFASNAVTGIVPVMALDTLRCWPSQPVVEDLRQALTERLPCFAR